MAVLQRNVKFFWVSFNTVVTMSNVHLSMLILFQAQGAPVGASYVTISSIVNYLQLILMVVLC